MIATKDYIVQYGLDLNVNNNKNYYIYSKTYKMKQTLNELKRMQKLAGVLNENVSPQLTQEEKVYLESEVEKFLNSSLFNSEILANDSENFNPTKEELAIQFIINTLRERISY